LTYGRLKKLYFKRFLEDGWSLLFIYQQKTQKYMKNFEEQPKQEQKNKSEADMKKMIAESVAAGDYEKVAALAKETQEKLRRGELSGENPKKTMYEEAQDEEDVRQAAETERQAAEKAAEEKARIDKEEAEKLAAIREKIQGSGTENSQTETSTAEKNTEKIQEIKASLMSLFNSAGYNSWEEKSKGIGAIEDEIDKLDQKSQEQLGEEFFNETIGKNYINNKEAYQVYQSLKESGVTKKFRELENARLKEWNPNGPGFTL